MKGLAGGLWLAAALLVDVAKGDRVNFTRGFGDGLFPADRPIESTPRSGVFNAIPNTPRVFFWTAKNLGIDKVFLYVHERGTNKARIVAGGSALRDSVGGLNIIPLQVMSDSHGGNVTINDPFQLIGPDPLIHSPDALYFEAIWPFNGPTTGRSYSPAFTLKAAEDTLSLTMSSANDKLFKNEPFQPEQPDPNLPTEDPNSNGSGSIDSGSGMGTTDPNPTTTASESDSASPSSGLPKAALAGIAAACGIIGLLLIGFLVWYFLRKRQRQRAALAVPGPYGAPGRTRTDELMAEKEANLAGSGAGGATGGAPGSPYSDAGGLEEQPPPPRAIAVAGHRSSLSGGGGGGATAPLIPPQGPALPVAEPVAGDGPPSYTPYTDRPAAVAAAGTAASVASADEGRATPQGVSTQYAHLVEEGMTPEEIRRLEEEERALDAAIEQAVRRPTG